MELLLAAGSGFRTCSTEKPAGRNGCALIDVVTSTSTIAPRISGISSQGRQENPILVRVVGCSWRPYLGAVHYEVICVSEVELNSMSAPHLFVPTPGAMI